MIRALALFLLMVACPVRAEAPSTTPSTSPSKAPTEAIVAGLSQNSVSITVGFSGEEILIYGAVRRETPPPDGAPLEVIVTVEGPSAPLVVRRKAHRAGIWVNAYAVNVDLAPSFYVVASTGRLKDVLSPVEDLRHRISIRRAIRAVDITRDAPDAPAFVEALIRLREENGTYRVDEGGILLSEDTLFRTDVALPSNLVEGDYRVRLFLTRGGKVVDWQEQLIPVRKEGLERSVFVMSRERPLAYGVLSVLIAVFAGWAASTAFRLIRS